MPGGLASVLSARELGLKGHRGGPALAKEMEELLLLSSPSTWEPHEYPTGDNVVCTISLSVSSCSMFVASSHGDHTVKVFSVLTGKLLEVLRGHPRTPWSVKYHPLNSDIVASGDLSGEVRVWSVSQKRSTHVLRFTNKSIHSLSFHPITGMLAVAASSTLRMWDWASSPQGATTEDELLPTAYNTVVVEKVYRAVVFSPTGNLLFAAATEKFMERPKGKSSKHVEIPAVITRVYALGLERWAGFSSQANKMAPNRSIDIRSFLVMVPQVVLYSDGGLSVSADGSRIITCATCYTPLAPPAATAPAHSSSLFSAPSSSSRPAASVGAGPSTPPRCSSPLGGSPVGSNGARQEFSFSSSSSSSSSSFSSSPSTRAAAAPPPVVRLPRNKRRGAAAGKGAPAPSSPALPLAGGQAAGASAGATAGASAGVNPPMPQPQATKRGAVTDFASHAAAAVAAAAAATNDHTKVSDGDSGENAAAAAGTAAEAAGAAGAAVTAAAAAGAVKRRPMLAEDKHYFDPYRSPLQTKGKDKDKDKGKGKDLDFEDFLADHLVVINVPRALAAAIAAHEAAVAEKQACEYVFESGNETAGARLQAAANKATSKATALALDVVELYRPLTSGLAHAITSVQFSPAETHALLGFGVRERGLLVEDHRLYQPSIEILRLDDRPTAPPAPAFVPWLTHDGYGEGEEGGGFESQCVELVMPPSPTTVAAAPDRGLRTNKRAKTAEQHRHQQSEQLELELRQGQGQGQGRERELVRVLARPCDRSLEFGRAINGDWTWPTVNAGLYGPEQREARTVWANVLRGAALVAAVLRRVHDLASILAECAAAEVDLTVPIDTLHSRTVELDPLWASLCPSSPPTLLCAAVAGPGPEEGEFDGVGDDPEEEEAAAIKYILAMILRYPGVDANAAVGSEGVSAMDVAVAKADLVTCDALSKASLRNRFSFSSQDDAAGGMRTVAVVLDPKDEVNIARFMPVAGTGLVYGSKTGRVRATSSRGRMSTST